MFERMSNAVQLLEFSSKDSPSPFIVVPCDVDLIQEIEEFDPDCPESLGVYLFDRFEEADEYAHSLAEESGVCCYTTEITESFVEVIR